MHPLHNLKNPSFVLGQYPQTRLRRNRQHDWSRRLMAESSLSVNDLIWPIFMRNETEPAEIPTFPGVKRLTLAEIEENLTPALNRGIKALGIFPLVPLEARTAEGSEAINPENLMCQAIRHVKKLFPHVGIFADVALDPYTTHGHDGILVHGQVANDETLEILCQQALIQAQAGADFIAPSDMMDGRVSAIRHTLDHQGLTHVGILSYAAKYASAFYGPFRDALQSSKCLGQAHKKTYQMDPANTHEALREVAQDLAEGADMVMIKPGLPYLDIIQRVKATFLVPTFVYQVSGEYAMLKFAAQAGALDYNQALLETLIGFKRAGADAIFTYAAPEIAQLLSREPF